MLNWPQLVAQGRAKDMGIAWTDEEQEALAALIAHTGLERSEVARYVRQGILTPAQLDSAEKPATRKEIESKAAELGIAFDASAPDTVLEKAIGTAEKKTAKANKK